MTWFHVESILLRRAPHFTQGGGRGEGGNGGAGGEGGVMPRKMKSGFGHHRLDIGGPSNGRHKIALDRPDFIAMLRSLPSAIDDEIDTLHEPNAICSQSRRSASFFFSFPFPASSSCRVFSCFPCLSFLSFPFSFFAFLFFLLVPFLYLLLFSLFVFSKLTCVCRAYA